MTPTLSRLANKFAIVTGAGRGIGHAIVQTLAREGAEVFFNFQQDRAAAEELCASVQATGGKATALQADSSSLDDIRRFLAEVARQTPHIDILVNNVGTASPGLNPLGAIEPEEYDRLFHLNTRGLFFTTQEALKLLRDGGRIINLSSVAAHWQAPGRSVYAGSKAAVEAFTRVWASELGPHNITVNCVAPGLVETERLRRIMPPDLRASFVAETPLGRIGQPDDIADIVLFLASHEGRWITGQTLTASGGLA